MRIWKKWSIPPTNGSSPAPASANAASPPTARAPPTWPRGRQTALKDAHVKAEDIDLIIVATVTPDMAFPATACYRAAETRGRARPWPSTSPPPVRVSLRHGHRGRRKSAPEPINTALIIGAEKLTSIINWKDRNTCVLFGDGAGAAVLTRATDKSGRILSTIKGTDGTQTGILKVPGSGTAIETDAELQPMEGSVFGTIHMAGREVYKHAVTEHEGCRAESIADAGLHPDDIAMLIPHQANLRIIEAIKERLALPDERVFVNLHKYGNTSAAAVAIALDEAQRTKAIKRGDNIVMVAFGAGLTWAAACIRW